MALLLGTWELGSGYGHIAHLAPLAHALNVRGHRLAVAARNPATAKAAPGSPFADILILPLYRPAPRPRTPTLTYAQVVADGGLTDLPAALKLVGAWLALFKRVGPKAIIAEHAPVSLLAAHVARLPAVILGSGFMVPPATRPLPSLLPWTKASESDRAKADAAADSVVREVCRAFDAPPLDGMAALIATAVPYLTTWPELDIHGPRRGSTYYGPLGGFAGEARPDWPRAEGPPTFVYLPFDRPRAPELVQSLTELGWPAIWHAAQPPTVDLPTNILFSPRPVDIAHVLGEAALLIGRAAHGTASRGLMSGRPQLALPDTLETILLARQLAGHKLGMQPKPGVDNLRAALESIVTDTEIAAATARAKTRYGHYHPQLAAAQLADALIGKFGL